MVRTVSKQIVMGLIERALQGKITLEEFYSTWPKDLEDDKPYSEIYQDLENAIEHFPGYFFTGRPKLAVFKNSHEYKALKEHLDRLKGE